MFNTVDSGKIKVCECDKQTPLIWTFKFPGKEYWCPRCGYKEGMFGAGVNIHSTPELEKSADDWKEKARPYLSGETEDWTYEAE